MANYKSRHTGQEVDDAVDKINSSIPQNAIGAIKVTTEIDMINIISNANNDIIGRNIYLYTGVTGNFRNNAFYILTSTTLDGVTTYYMREILISSDVLGINAQGGISLKQEGASSTPILSISATDIVAETKIFPNKIMCSGESSNITETYVESLLNNKRLSVEINQNYGDEGHFMQYRSENTAKSFMCYASEFDEHGDEIYDSDQYGYFEATPYQLRHTYMYEHPKTSANNMLPLYIDRLGRIYAVSSS